MPLIVMCGFPSSGKTRRAEELKVYFEQTSKLKVHIVGETSLAVDKNSVYVYCLTSHEQSSTWNSSRDATEQYNQDICDALVLRFEAPDSRNRWDSPLFTILQDDTLPFEAISDALFKRKAPPPNQSTQSQPLSSANFLYELDKITQDVLMAIFNSQKTSVPGDLIAVPGATEKIELNRGVNMAELRKLRRQFISYTKMHPTDKTGQISNMFVQYLNKSLH
ncbi:protein KTI12 homolog [Cynoglossus semilaevis]|uniref:protein KTI12 homolog n=1 Tax=Cynoglossus semilaevis TaxID=244447 RepID=UPI000496F487|nr:protein KTI12 homolog [Cynoglossus semilaevis]